MNKKRRKEALHAFENYAKTEWVKPENTISDLWLAAVEWADNNLSDVCSTTGLGDIPIGRLRDARTKIRNKDQVR